MFLRARRLLGVAVFCGLAVACARGGTDRVDARLIARYLVREHVELHPYVPPTPVQREIDQLLHRRATLVNTKTRLQLSLQGLTGYAADLRVVLKRLQALIVKFDHRLRQLAAHQAEAQRRVESVLGIGPLLGVALTNTFERVPLLIHILCPFRIQSSPSRRQVDCWLAASEPA